MEDLRVKDVQPHPGGGPGLIVIFDRPVLIETVREGRLYSDSVWVRKTREVLFFCVYRGKYAHALTVPQIREILPVVMQRIGPIFDGKAPWPRRQEVQRKARRRRSGKGNG